MTAMTDEEADLMQRQLDEHRASQAEATKAANRALLAPLVALGLGGTGPLTCSLSSLAAGLRAHSIALTSVDPEFPVHAVQVALVIDGLDRRLRTMVANNAAALEETPS